jgi:hypothetical protein
MLHPAPRKINTPRRGPPDILTTTTPAATQPDTHPKSANLKISAVTPIWIDDVPIAVATLSNPSITI